MQKEFEASQRGGTGVQRDVTVTFNGTTISVHPDPVKPNQGEDTVNWSGRVQFTIKGLPGGPIVASGSGSSWSASAGPWNTVAKMKYDVTATGFDDLDPQIDVQPSP